jgi:hypothetical protein
VNGVVAKKNNTKHYESLLLLGNGDLKNKKIKEFRSSLATKKKQQKVPRISQLPSDGHLKKKNTHNTAPRKLTSPR